MNKSKVELGIKFYGVGVTTLEEVFLSVGKDEDENKIEESKGGFSKINSEEENKQKASLMNMQYQAHWKHLTSKYLSNPNFFSVATFSAFIKTLANFKFLQQTCLHLFLQILNVWVVLKL